MEKGRPPLEPALRAWTARAERALFEHPSPETLATYHEGRLVGEEAERLRGHLALCAECTQLLLDLDAFPEIEPATGGRIPTDSEVEAAWQGIRGRLGGGEEMPLAPVEGASNVVRLPPPKPAAPPVRRSRPGWVWALAASWLVAAGLGVWVFELQRENAGLKEPSGEAVIADLPADGDSTRGEPQGSKALPAGKPLLLILDAPGLASHSSYAADLLSAGGSVLWTGRSLSRGADGSFTLHLPPGFLASGSYAVRLYGTDSGKRELLASFPLRIGSP